MSEMEIRIAKAIARLVNPHLNPEAKLTSGPRAEIGQPFYAYYLPWARAAIEAMREPAPQMLEAGGAVEDDSDAGFCVGEAAASRCWQAMIDAALKKD